MPLTNTLENARRLESLGFTHQQAQGMAEVLESAAQDTRGEVATKEFVRTEMNGLETGIRTEMKDLETGIRTEMKELESRIGGEMKDLGTGIRAEMKELESRIRIEMKDLELRIAERLRAQMIWFFAVQAALLGATVAVLKLLP